MPPLECMAYVYAVLEFIPHLSKRSLFTAATAAVDAVAGRKGAWTESFTKSTNKNWTR